MLAQAWSSFTASHGWRWRCCMAVPCSQCGASSPTCAAPGSTSGEQGAADCPQRLLSFSCFHTWKPLHAWAWLDKGCSVCRCPNSDPEQNAGLASATGAAPLLHLVQCCCLALVCAVAMSISRFRGKRRVCLLPAGIPMATRFTTPYRSRRREWCRPELCL